MSAERTLSALLDNMAASGVKAARTRDESLGIYRIPPNTYIHVLDTNTNVTAIVEGPQTYTRQDHQSVTLGPEKMINIPPRHYIVIANPAVRDEEGGVLLDKHRQVRLKHGETEIRVPADWPEPFPLQPGETIETPCRLLKVVEKNAALNLRALRDFADTDPATGAAVARVAGDEWQFRGPGTYVPRVEAEQVATVRATVIKFDQALKLRAKRATVDSAGAKRLAGEEWLIREAGAYLLSVDEEVVQVVDSYTLTETQAIHLQAMKTFTDVYGVRRKAGEEWLVTFDMAESHLPDVYETCLNDCVALTTLSNRQYCVVVDPYVDGVQRLAAKELRKGEAQFFLRPGEALLNGIEDVHVLGEDEALLLVAQEAFADAAPAGGGDGPATDGEEAQVTRRPGDKWMVYGPAEYIPPVEVEILESRRAIPLDENEGVYVRDTRTGAVRAVIGKTYMLQPHEELWRKELTSEVEELIQQQSLGSVFIDPGKRSSSVSKAGAAAAALKRDHTKVVQFRVPHNACVQVYDFKRKASRVVFGPSLVCLMPDEQFTILKLSGDKPKRPNVIRSLCLMLGPDFMTDVVTVETSDHARLRLTLAYNWHFEVDKDHDGATAAEAAKVFNVRDFTGDACKALASRVRGAVASEPFDNFHKHSAKIIRGSVMGLKDGKVGDHLKFDANNLVITNVDIQSVEPVDKSTRESLQKSVQLAIEITTSSQEMRARHDAHAEDEAAKGRLQRQKLKNEAEAEAERANLLRLQAESAAVESSGQATAEAKARAEAAAIEGAAAVKQAELQAQSLKIQSEARLAQTTAQQDAELSYQERVNALEVARARQLAEIEASKFKAVVDAIGRDTIASIARAGPEMQAKLLQGLGLKGYLVTDGKSPINLFNTAQGMLGQGPAAAGAAAAE